LTQVNISTAERRVLKRTYIVELAAQFRDGSLIMKVNFPGYGAYTEHGFATDISDTCVWMSPLSVETSRDQLFR
jgi:hypothetical protein